MSSVDFLLVYYNLAFCDLTGGCHVSVPLSHVEGPTQASQNFLFYKFIFAGDCQQRTKYLFTKSLHTFSRLYSLL